MTIEHENPFADYGNIVNGSHFIGRQKDLKVIESRITRPHEGGNLAIIGEPRIGKSSLVWKAVMDRREELIAKRLVPVWMNIANFNNAPILFRTLVTECYDKLEDLEWLTEAIDRAKKRVLQDELSWTEGYGKIQRFFEKVRQADIRIIFILDEFDHARILFKNDISGFQGLRELSYRPEWRVNFITTSRRTIRDIELQTDAISTFDGIFHKHYLSMFKEETLNIYFDRFTALGISVDNALKEKINFYCGGYPFLLEMLGYEIVERFFECNIVDIDQSVRDLEHSFLDQYDRMAERMREDGNLDKLLQILFGPVVDVKQADVDNFLRYGLIKATPQETYQAFSRHFQAYLKLIERSTDLWSLWKETEVSLRHLIVEKLLEKYGESWARELEQKNPKARDIFNRCRTEREKEKKSFGNRASQSLLDFTYPKELFELIFVKTEWNDIFKSIFGKDRQYWEQRAQLLSKLRNPLAHNRDQVIYEHERQIAEGYCKEILGILKK